MSDGSFARQFVKDHDPAFSESQDVDVEMGSPCSACSSRTSPQSSGKGSFERPGPVRSESQDGNAEMGSPCSAYSSRRCSMPRRSILKAPTPPPKRRSSLSFPWAGGNQKKSVKWPDTKTIGEKALSYLSPWGSRLGLGCLRSRQPTFSTQLEEVHQISPNPSPESDAPTPLWVKRHNLGAALLPGEKFDEDDEKDSDESAAGAQATNEAWFCGQVEHATEDELQPWLVTRPCFEDSFQVAEDPEEDPEDGQDSPCTTEEYDTPSNPEVVDRCSPMSSYSLSLMSSLTLRPVEASETLLSLEASEVLQSDVFTDESKKPLKRRHSQSGENFDFDFEGKENTAPAAKRARCVGDGNGLWPWYLRIQKMSDNVAMS